jgi:ABC-type nickel/cobalt efflux system permease component RcnA
MPRAAMAHDTRHANAHTHAHDDPACATCGHRHGPTAAEAANATTLREMAVLVAAIALRPCTGALILLLLTVRMQIPAAGIAGTYAMGLGTAAVTMGVAALAVLAREGALDWAARLGGARVLVPVLELTAGAVVVLVALRALVG